MRSQVAERRTDRRLANLLGAVSTGITDAIDESTAASANLDGAAPAALIALLDFVPSRSVQALSQVVGLTHSGAVRLVDRLVADGLVTRGTSLDARSRSISLTPSGVRLARQARRSRERVVTRAIDELTESQRATLTKLCERLIAGITRQRLAQRGTGTSPAGGALCRMCDFGACGRDNGDCPAAEAAAAFTNSQEVPRGTR